MDSKSKQMEPRVKSIEKLDLALGVGVAQTTIEKVLVGLVFFSF